MDSNTFQRQLQIGCNVDWCKTNPGRSAIDKARTQGINVPKLFKDRGFDHARIRVTGDVTTDPQLKVEVATTVGECMGAGLVPIIAYQAGSFKDTPTSDFELNHVAHWWETMHTAIFGFTGWKDVAYNLIIETTDQLKLYNNQLNECYRLTTVALREAGHEGVLIYAPNKISSPHELTNLWVPDDDQAVAEWHYYAAGPSKELGSKKKWTISNDSERAPILSGIRAAQEWSHIKGIPTWVGAWMANNYNADDDAPALTHPDGAPAGGDYSIEEQIAFASYLAGQLKLAEIPFAINSDTKYFNRETNEWYGSTAPVLDAIMVAGKAEV